MAAKTAAEKKIQQLQKDAQKAKIPIQGTESVEILEMLLLVSKEKDHSAELKKLQDAMDKRQLAIDKSTVDFEERIAKQSKANEEAKAALDSQSEESQKLQLLAEDATKQANKAQGILQKLIDKKASMDSQTIDGMNQAALMQARNRKARKNPNLANKGAKLKTKGRKFKMVDGVKHLIIDKVARKNYRGAVKAAKKEK